MGKMFQKLSSQSLFIDTVKEDNLIMNSAYVIVLKSKQLLLLIWNLILLSINKVFYYEIGNRYSNLYLILNIVVVIVFLFLLMPHRWNIDLEHNILIDIGMCRKRVIDLNKSNLFKQNQLVLTFLFYNKSIKIMTKTSYLMLYQNVINNINSNKQ